MPMRPSHIARQRQRAKNAQAIAIREQEHRDHLVLLLLANGVTYRELALDLGMTIEGVTKIRIRNQAKYDKLKAEAGVRI